MNTQQMIAEFKAIREATNIDWGKFRQYSERAMMDDDGRTPILSYPEWVSAGRPEAPFTNG